MKKNDWHGIVRNVVHVHSYTSYGCIDVVWLLFHVMLQRDDTGTIAAIVVQTRLGAFYTTGQGASPLGVALNRQGC